MATTFVGSAVSPRISGTGDTANWYCFAIENQSNSGVIVYPLRGTYQIDPGVASTGIMNMVRGYRASSISRPNGAVLLAKAPFKTSYTSSSGVNIWCAVSPDESNTSPLGAVEFGPKGTESFIPRMRDLTGQVISDDGELMPETVAAGSLALYPGESLVFEIYVNASTLSNSVNALMWGQFVWQEDTATTYTISGTVTLSTVGVIGAEVVILVADDNNMTNAYLHSIQTTTTGGVWSANIPTGKIAYAYSNDYTGGTYYTAPGVPYVS